MPKFRRITKRDDPTQIAMLAARYQGFLAQALSIARESAKTKPHLVQDILATGTAEGLSATRDVKVASLSYRAERFKRSWHSLIPWESLENETPSERAEAIIDMIETTIRMTETDSWPKSRRTRKSTTRKARKT
jgi:hypothetical protein